MKNRYEGVNLIHIPMNYSSELANVGKFRISKVTELFKVLCLGVQNLLFKRIDAIYYPPAGHSLVPVLRDIITLSVLRIFRKRVIFHFHAMGLKEFYVEANWLIKKLMKAAFGKPDVCVCMSPSNQDDIEFLNPEKIVIIPYGIQDDAKKYLPREKKSDKPCILYLGNIYKSKGVSCLLDAAEILKKEGEKFQLVFVGGIKDEKYKTELCSYVFKNIVTVYLHKRVGVKCSKP